MIDRKDAFKDFCNNDCERNICDNHEVKNCTAGFCRTIWNDGRDSQKEENRRLYVLTKRIQNYYAPTDEEWQFIEAMLEEVKEIREE